LITEHSNSGILPEIPGELLVKLFIHKKEEQALGIGEDFTYGWRRENLIPDSDGLVAMIEDQQKRDQIQFLQLCLINLFQKKTDIKVYQSLYQSKYFCNREL